MLIFQTIRRRSSHYPQRRVQLSGRGAVLAWACLFLTFFASAHAANVVTIGDSLTAEYDTIPDVPNFINLPTDYAKVTVPGWESMSWVEVLQRMEPGNFNFGGYKNLPDLWSVPRMSGFEYNWGIPGATSTQYAEFVTADALSNLIFYTLRLPLEDQLRNTATRVVIWLGGNDFRESYGTIYDGGSSAVIVSRLVGNVSQIIDFVRRQNPTAQIVLVNVPDLGATPAKKIAHPDPAKRARVSAATQAANSALAALAEQKGVALADAYALTANLVNNVPFNIGTVQIVNDMNADNNPRYAFTRDGLHPNTAGQIANARAIIDAFNRGYGAAIPQITDARALALLGLATTHPDFNGDGKTDILWENTATGQRNIWLMNGSTFAGLADLGIIQLAWSIACTGDFNGDGKTDIVWQNTINGRRLVWLMNGSTLAGKADLGTTPPGWSIAGSGDFNDDGRTDILWQNTITGRRLVRFMNGSTFVGRADLGVIPPEWSIAGAGDFSGDGKPDILWQNTVTGQRLIWFMNGSTFAGWADLGTIPTEWSIAGTGDFNSDGKADILWQNTVTGQRLIWLMNGSTFAGWADLGIVSPEWRIKN